MRLIPHIVTSAFLAALALICSASPLQDADSLKTGYGISVRNNLAWDLASEPNVGFEVPVGEHVTVGGNAALKSWPRWTPWDWDNKTIDRHWRNFAVVPEVRYYLGQVYDGWFAGADFLYTHFNVGDIDFPFGMYPDASDFRLQGAFWAGGVFAGYAWWPWQHWRLELEAGVAAGLAAYDKYTCAHCGTKLPQERKPAVVPKIGVNIAYNTVGKDEVAQRRARRGNIVLSGTDTITVLNPPVVFTVHLKDVVPPETSGDMLSHEEPWVIPIEKYRPLDYLTRPGKDSIQYVTFKLNDSKLLPEYKSNARVLDQLVKTITRIRDDESVDELLISIVGLASIEGRQGLNDTLSVSRSMAVADYLNRETGVSRRFFETMGKGEAWDWFRNQLEAIPDGGEGLTAQQVRKLLGIIYDEPDPDRREALIRADAPLYKALESLLEDQRNSGYIRIYYHNAPDKVTERFNSDVMGLVKGKRYHDAVRLIKADPELEKRVQSDPEAANAYGMALYFTALDNRDADAEARAIAIVRQAAKDGSHAAQENLEGIETYGPARKEYEAWLDAMKEN